MSAAEASSNTPLTYVVVRGLPGIHDGTIESKNFGIAK